MGDARGRDEGGAVVVKGMKFLLVFSGLLFLLSAPLAAGGAGFLVLTAQESLAQSEGGTLSSEDLGSDASSGFTPSGAPGAENADRGAALARPGVSGTPGAGVSAPSDSVQAPLAPGSASPTVSASPSAAAGGGGGASSGRSLIPGEGDFGTFSFYVKALGAFILVIACLLIFLKLLGRMNRGRVARGGMEFTLKGTLSLDSRRYLAAVEVDGRLLILGVAPERISSLAHWNLDPPSDDEGAFGSLGLEDTKTDFSFDASLGKSPASDVPAKSRDGLKEPAFYRGKTEEEEKAEEGVILDLDEPDYGRDADLPEFSPEKPGKSGKGPE
ncbi:MAG: flagellar biosynthetic protein FliO [Deltaproteobacteria bacterium]|jgi:flagellar biogenesis protein FliO|nr:flagellar biosynthetic protein FliO [Deltaproteobacteria bacterium]